MIRTDHLFDIIDDDAADQDCGPPAILRDELQERVDMLWLIRDTQRVRQSADS